MTLRRILVCLMTIGGCATVDGLAGNGDILTLTFTKDGTSTNQQWIAECDFNNIDRDGQCPADTATYIEQPTENTK